ncbi:phospholipid carrier-dependent glycosyltransferase [Phytohabitans sp. ZYX-F-186]|uniref:Phospholipid carrier-dependent glycosyltransferase n=1 Tax=Phytohabitans maris TaxID=3071409 RepID=A0ABU0ZDM5_9ACTN|nr:phospholipid carrier-dependent glycosyltransferase [Phytohabitans sp. ZYX-F-186]MDQ7904457.1 phospholipid carrier-dependent glycosyltransferase [Phytohabitans sp. ZYX-F-186]
MTKTAAPPATATEPREGRVAAVLGRRRRWLYPLVVAVILGQMAVAMVTAASQQTPTIDEPVYAGTAVWQLQEHSLRYNPEHPPLGKLVIGAGLALSGAEVDPAFTGDQTALGRHLLYESGYDPWRLMLLARLPVILLTLLFGLVVLAFARDVAGPAGGLVALSLYAFSPDVIAHGSLATLDLPVVGFLLTSVWLAWRARQRPRLYVPLAGLALGAALATKMSALPAVPVLLLLILLSVWSAAGRTWRGAAWGVAAAAGAALLAVAVVWGAYLAVDPRLEWVPPPDVPATGGWRGLVARLLPFPEPYGDGLRMQFGFEDSRWSGFLFGELYSGGRWYYLPAALLVKSPLGAIALWLAGAVALLAVPRLRAAAPYVLVPAAVLLGVAMTGARDFGTRYALVVPVFLAVAAAALTAVRWRWPGAGRERRATAARVAAAVLVLLVAASSLRTFPYYLPYSNEAFGGPARTHEHLHDSNVDWGQDLGRLADRLRERYAGERVWLVYKGSGVPSWYGIESSDPLAVPAGEVRGLLVVSDSSAAKATGPLAELIRTSEPIDTVGHSITLYRR